MKPDVWPSLRKLTADKRFALERLEFRSVVCCGRCRTHRSESIHKSQKSSRKRQMNHRTDSGTKLVRVSKANTPEGELVTPHRK